MTTNCVFASHWTSAFSASLTNRTGTTVLPFTIAYTIFVYRVFHGKATGLTYGDPS